MAAHTFDPAAFRSQFPQFASAAQYPDGMLSGYFTMATCYIEPFDSPRLQGDCLQLALNLMTAHLAVEFSIANTGENSVGIITSSTIDKVSVTQQVPQTRNAWQFFLSKSGYGQQLWALLSGHAIGGFMVGGSMERGAVRKAGGVF